MKLRIIIASSLFSLGMGTLVTHAATKPDPSLILASQGKTSYVITLANDAIPSEKVAALRLQKYLQQVTGTQFRIRPEKEVATNTPQILIGAGGRVKKSVAIDWNRLGLDGIVIKTVGRNIVLAGGRPQGASYAVDSFLEDSIGVRWWTSGESTVPKRSTIHISPLSINFVPKIKFRGINASGVSSDNELAARLKLNGHRTLGWCGPNTFDILLPTAKYFQKHPEWYSDPNNDGKPCTSASKMPQTGQWQLNLTDKAARVELTKVALDHIRKNPDEPTFAILPNDNESVCRTPEQAELLEREGSASGMLLKFVNAVAADIEKEFPHIVVETLAYRDTYTPPRFIRPRRNVAIYLSSITADFARPLASDSNKAFQESIKGWKAISNRVYVWDYITNFWNYTCPHPNMNVLGPNVRYFAENEVGVFEQGDDYSGGTGDFVAMRTWVLAHLMWNPKLDQRELQAEFLKGYYGPAAPSLQNYIDLIQGAFLRTGDPLSCSHFNFSYLTLDTMNDATRLFRNAEKAVADNKTLVQRVRRERMALDYVWLLRYKALRAEEKKTNAMFKGPDDTIKFANAFIANARAFKIPQYSEGAEVNGSAAARLVALAQPASPLPDFLRGVSSSDIVDVDPSLPTLGAGAVTVADSTSPTGYTMTMPGHSNEWGIQWGLSDPKLATGKWRCYIYARVDAPGAVEGPGLGYGSYDTLARTMPFQGTQQLSKFIPSEYALIDLGARQWNLNMLLWIAPPNRQDVKSINIGRIIFVRDNSD